MIIKNRAELLSHGHVAGRRAVLDILETGLAAGDPYENVTKCVRIEGGKLIVGNETFRISPMDGSTHPDRPRPFDLDAPLVFDLDKVGDIFVVGGGKAAQRQAEGLEAVLGDLIVDGQVNAKKGDTIRLKRIPVTLAGHPLPDEDSVIGARRIVEIEHRAQKGDIVFYSESGGGSALMTLPAPGLTLQDLQDVNRVLYFEHGAPMPVANAVRGLMSVLRLKHSRHVGDATLIQICTEERPPHWGAFLNGTPRSGVDDFQHAIDLLHEYDSWDEIPEAARRFLLRADPAHQLLKGEEWWDRPHFRFRIMGPEVMLDAAQARARELGLDARILISSLSSVDARAIGEMAGYLGHEVEMIGQPCPAPCAWLIGGELVVPTGKGGGVGGRNQEFALAAAARIVGSERIVIGSADSDGRDGPTEHAGAIIDGGTMARAASMGLDGLDALRRHDSNTLLKATGDAIHTGVLYTNVQDLRVVYVSGMA